MIPVESFRKFRKIDLIAIIVLVILWSVITTLVNIPNSQLSFMLVLFITTIFAVGTAFFIRRAGAVIIFYLLGALITVPFNNLGGFGWNKLVILVIAGVVFELIFLLLKLEIKNVPADMILGAGFSMASIPFTMLLLIPATKEIMPYVWNFALMAFIIGIIGAIVMFLVWYNIKGLKFVVKFEYGV